ncbi:hypothetical protein HaLaN_31084 [Haematococcus lacustris]|uniref:Uncharacterized protein n=1 Tax=Haematococcus lacustris TaxID=44745 RepID=A0A6A0AG88_HAELA|nr:hypothetical protein HaLaN_31084 [Haematococcus lacustris]
MSSCPDIQPGVSSAATPCAPHPWLLGGWEGVRADWLHLGTPCRHGLSPGRGVGGGVIRVIWVWGAVGGAPGVPVDVGCCVAAARPSRHTQRVKKVMGCGVASFPRCHHRLSRGPRSCCSAEASVACQLDTGWPGARQVGCGRVSEGKDG